MSSLVYLAVLATGLDHRFFASEEGLLSISIAEALSYLCLAFVFLEELSLGQMGLQLSPWYRRAAWWPMRAYCAWVCVAATAVWILRSSTDGLHALKDTIPALILYVATVRWVRTPRGIHKFVSIVLLMLSLLSLLALAQYLFGGPYLNPLRENVFDKFQITGEARIDNPAVGTFGTQNAFAVFLAPLLLMCLGSRIIAEREQQKKAAKGGDIALVAGVLALLATQAKLVIGCFGLCAGWLLLMRTLGKPPSRPAMVTFAVISVALLGAGLAVLGILGTALPLGLTLGTVWGRVGLAAEAVHLLSVDQGIFVWGGGLTTYQFGMPSSYGIHVEYLNQALMWGVPGAVLFAVLIITALGRPGVLGWSIKLALLCACLTFLFESAAGSQRIAMFFLLLGINEASYRARLPFGATTPGGGPIE